MTSISGPRFGRPPHHRHMPTLQPQHVAPRSDAFAGIQQPQPRFNPASSRQACRARLYTGQVEQARILALHARPAVLPLAKRFRAALARIRASAPIPSLLPSFLTTAIHSCILAGLSPVALTQRRLSALFTWCRIFAIRG